MNRTPRTKLVGVCALACLGTCTALADFGFEFNNDGVLPSRQGATYEGTAVESVAYSDSGGLLHQHTSERAAYLYDTNLNRSADMELDWSARVISDSSSNVEIALDDTRSNTIWDFIMGTSGLSVYTASGSFQVGYSFDATDALHVYKLLVPAGTDAFDMYVDGTLRFSGVGVTQPELTALVWGDTTAGGGNGSADWDYIRFHNPASTPEPFTMGLSLACLGTFVRRRMKNQ